MKIKTNIYLACINILRNKRKSTIMILLIATALSAMLLSVLLMFGFMSLSADLSTGIIENRELFVTVESDGKAEIGKLSSMEHVKYVTVAIEPLNATLIISGEDENHNIPMEIKTGSQEHIPKMRKANQQVKRGEILLPKSIFVNGYEKDTKSMIGKEYVVKYFSDRKEEKMDLTVCGVYNDSELKTQNEAYMNYEDMLEIYNKPDRQQTVISVVVDTSENVYGVKKKVALGVSEVINQKRGDDQFEGIYRVGRAISTVTMLISIISSILLMYIFFINRLIEEQPYNAMLRVVGYRDRTLMQMSLIENGIIIVIAYVVASGISIGAIFIVKSVVYTQLGFAMPIAYPAIFYTILPIALSVAGVTYITHKIAKRRSILIVIKD